MQVTYSLKCVLASFAITVNLLNLLCRQIQVLLLFHTMSTDSNMDAKHVTKLLLMDAYRQNTKQDMNLALWRFYMNLIMGVSFVARTPLWHIDIASYAVMHGYRLKVIHNSSKVHYRS